MGRPKREIAPWSSVDAARAECSRRLSPDTCQRRILEYQCAREFVRASNVLRAEARLLLEFYRDLRALRPKLSKLWRTHRRYEKGPLREEADWIVTGINLTYRADLVLEGTRAGSRVRVEARVIADHLVNAERRKSKRITSTTAALLEIASGGKPAKNEDDFEKSRKRWDAALQLARASQRGTELADFMEAIATRNDLTSY